MAMRVRVCRVDEVVPGELTPFQVKGVTWPVIVTSVDDELFAFPGVCPHENVPLADGYLFDKTVMCGAHAYTFDLTTGRCGHDKELVLRRYPITRVGDELWVDLL